MTSETSSPADAVFELRQYTLHPRRRDELIALFERSFIEPQEAAGSHVLGTFRDLDDPDRFVWMRSFADMASRLHALETFYGGPVWQSNRSAANATILDSDNVLLLHPTDPARRLPQQAERRAGVIGVSIHYLGDVDPAAFATFFEGTLRPRLRALGADPLTFATELAPNDFPRLPVRRERVFASITRWADAGDEEAFHRRISAMSGWRDQAPESVLPALMRKPERLRLEPTGRSRLR